MRTTLQLISLLLLAATPASAAPLDATLARDLTAADAMAAFETFLAKLNEPAVSATHLAAAFTPGARLEWVATPTAIGPGAIVDALLLKLQNRTAPRVTFRIASARSNRDGGVQIDGVANAPLGSTNRPGERSDRMLYAGLHVWLERGADGRWLITRWRVGKWSVVR